MTRSMMERGDESAAQGGGDESPLWHPWRRRCSGGDFRTGGGAAVVRWQRHAAARRRHAARRRRRRGRLRHRHVGCGGG